MMSTLKNEYNLLQSIRLASDINSCSFSIFNTLAIGTSDKAVSVWEWTEEGYTETNYSPLLLHDYGVISVVFSPDGKILATSSTDGMTHLFNVKTGAVKINIVQSMGGGVRQSAISQSDHPLLGTVTDEGYIFLWNMDNYEAQRYWVGHEVCVSCLAFSPDSYLLATGDSDGTYKLWMLNRAISSLFTADTLCGHVQKDAHNAGILTLAFSPNCATELGSRDYQLCSAGDDDVLKLWEVRVEALDHKDRNFPLITITFLKALEGHSSSVTSARYTSDGRYIGSTSLDSSARIWEVSTGLCVQELNSHKHSALCCAFSPATAFFVTGSNDKTVNLWALKKKPVLVSYRLPSENEEEIEKKPLEQRVFTVYYDNKVDSHVYSLDFNNQFDIVVGCSDKMVRPYIRRVSEWNEKSPLMRGHNYSVINVEFSKCYRYLVTVSLDGTAIIWNYWTGDIFSTVQLSTQGGRVARFSPASDWLALGCHDGKAYLWCVKTRSIKFAYPGHIESLNCLAFSPDGEYLATGCTAGQVKLWKVIPPVTQCQSFLENVHDLGVMSCDFSNVINKFKGTSTCVYQLATGGNDGLVKVFKLWPVEELMVYAEEMFCLRGHGGTITEVRFSAKTCNVLASCSIDRTARVWNMQNGQCLNVLSHHKGQVTCCAWSPETSLIATGSLDSSVVVWKVPKTICLNNTYKSEPSPRRVVNPGEPLDPLDLITLRLDDVTLSLDDMVTAVKRNSVEIPDRFLCPITQQLMIEPVIVEDGFTYENHAIQAWMVNGRNTSPMTNVPLSSTIVIPNVALKKEIKKFLISHYDPEDYLNQESPDVE